MVLQQWSSFLNFLMYLAVSLPLLLIGIKIFMMQTSYNDMQLIRDAFHSDNNLQEDAGVACAHDLGGKVIGLALVIASAVFHSVSIGDLMVWGIIGIVFQVIVYYAFVKLMPFKVADEILKGNVSVGLISARISFATGLIMAALIS